jgi:hypothetical protein
VPDASPKSHGVGDARARYFVLDVVVVVVVVDVVFWYEVVVVVVVVVGGRLLELELDVDELVVDVGAPWPATAEELELEVMLEAELDVVDTLELEILLGGNVSPAALYLLSRMAATKSPGLPFVIGEKLSFVPLFR